MAGGGLHEYARVTQEVLELVQIELYGLAGVAEGGGLIVAALREGAVNVYHYHGGRLERLNRDPVSFIAKLPYGAGSVVVGRDVARGRELHHLYRIDVDRPGEEVLLTGDVGPMRILGAAVDGGRVVFAGVTQEGIWAFEASLEGGARRVAPLPGLGMIGDLRGRRAAGLIASPAEPGRFHLLVLDVDTGRVTVHRPEGGSVTAATVAPDGTVTYALEGGGGAVLRSLDPDTGRDEPLSLPHSDLDEYKPASFNFLDYTPDGRLLASARRNGRSALFLDGRRLEAPEGTIGRAALWGGRVAASHKSLTTPPRIIAVGETGGYEPVLEGATPPWLPEALAASRFEWIESFDGERVPTFIVESGRAPKPGPTVVLVHGGPFAEDLDAWDVFTAALAAAGFHVVKPNYRGSTGYGEEWRLKIIGDPCGGELEDVASAARWALEGGLASHAYIMGYSYGGYMTLCALTRKPGLFKAGVAGASVADWEEMYELSDPAFKQFIDLLFAGRRELWRERSPITYVENLREPLMLVHPQNDSRTPLKPVLRFLERASELGKSVEAYIAPDMGHTVNTVEDAVKILLPAILFLARMERAR